MNQPQSPPSKASAKHQPKQTATGFSSQATQLKQARASLRQVLTRHSLYHTQLQPELQDELNLLTALRDKLDQGLVRIAVFGLVSRGKSAVLNALLGQKVFQTGPLHGVTQWPRSVRWSHPIEVANPAHKSTQSGKVQIELIDTPGLDEVGGQARAQMAREVTQQADLILFVIAGDLTRTEYTALCELREAQKPLLLVFNKMDLYPDRDRQAIYEKIRDQHLRELISPREIVMTAAEPAPLQVRVEWPNGKISYEWEAPKPQVEELKQQLLALLNREGQSLLALNALFQAKEAEAAIAAKVLKLRETEAEALIWRFTRYKAIAVALNPIGLLDVLGGTIIDLALIRALAKLYGFPITHYEASKLWKTILFSSGGLLLGELGSSLVTGITKSTTALAEGLGGASAYLGIAATQAGIAGYGSYIVGQATQNYLLNGCTWGDAGPSTLIDTIINSLDSDTILYKIQKSLKTKP
ncbi:Small GTP-binding protein domain [uncultured Synechococcales cyanobacterium]|uniref:Small GTP-binding protein domain n=1 Tax=uncultured Synechococcales cyanobacterium TaxID=1936017 RepID=A0A6J4VLH5_9CYAN|nr:Small GTP-binding protein domain [uncultured Synechococcales cyanobacterium]